MFFPSPLSTIEHLSISVVANNTALPVGWQKEPEFRGTFRIIWAPLLTLFLCVWTAVHLNLPRNKEKTRWYLLPKRQYWRRALWFTIGVFLPEMVAWCALRQYQEAKKLDDLVVKLLDEGRLLNDESMIKYVWVKICKVLLPNRARRQKQIDPEVSFQTQFPNFYSTVHSTITKKYPLVQS
jgi:hypothetical protein